MSSYEDFERRVNSLSVRTGPNGPSAAALPGEAQRDALYSVNGSSGEARIFDSSVCAIGRYDAVAGHSVPLGSGTFVHPLIGVTAAHVLPHSYEYHGRPHDEDFYAGVVFDDDVQVVRRIMWVRAHPTADIALFFTASEPKGRPFPNPHAISTALPKPGDRLGAIAYPLPMVVEDASGERLWMAQQRKFVGRVEELHLQGRDSVMLPGPCIRTSLAIHSGASGGAVVGDDGGLAAVCSTSIAPEGGEPVAYVTPVQSALEIPIPIGYANGSEADLTLKEILRYVCSLDPRHVRTGHGFLGWFD